MLIENLENRIELKKSVASWQDAIKTVAQPLLEQGYIKPEYVDAMIQNVMDNGDYIIIVPGFAMPHASPECGAIKNGMALLKLEEPVVFPEGEEVKLFIALAAKDGDAHLDILGQLAEFLLDDDIMEKMLAADDVAKIMELIK